MPQDRRAADPRHHQARPVELFAEHEAAALLAVPGPYDVPIFTGSRCTATSTSRLARRCTRCQKVYIGQHLDVRADSALVKLFCRGQLVKVHPRQGPGGRVTDPEDLPEHKVGYALDDLDRLVAAARRHGQDVGIYAQRLRDDKLPWTRLRQVYRLLGLARRYGDTPVNTACGRARPRCRVRHQDRVDAGEGLGETPRHRRRPRDGRCDPLCPRPGRVQPATAAADPHQRSTGAVMTKTSVPDPV